MGIAGQHRHLADHFPRRDGRHATALAILYFSEIIPKTLGATFWRTLAVPAGFTIAWLVKLVYPIRTGEHSQTAFAFGLFLDWARVSGRADFARLLMLGWNFGASNLADNVARHLPAENQWR